MDAEGKKVPISAAELTRTYGAQFDGDAWVLMIAVAEPLDETAFVAAIDPEIVHASSGRPTGMQMMLIETEYGYVLRFSLILFDDPSAPYELRLPVNPAPEGAYPMLATLAEQETVQILFFDAWNGEQIGRRIMRFDAEQRAAMRQVLEITAGASSDYERWTAAVAAAAEHL